MDKYTITDPEMKGEKKDFFTFLNLISSNNFLAKNHFEAAIF